MNPAVLNWGPVAVIVGGYLLGIYFPNRSSAQLGKRIDDLRTGMNQRFGDVNNRLNDMNSRISHLEYDVNNRLNDMNNCISDLKDFIHSENRRLEDRIERLETPVLHP